VTSADGNVATPILGMRGVRKSYGVTRALEGVSLDFHPGSLHAIIGENGAGKTTFVEILAGNVRPDEGEILLGGEPVRVENAADARRLGVAVVHQHLSLAPNVSVAENILALRLPARLGLVRTRALREQAQALLDRYGVPVDARVPAGSLSIGLQQQIEIVRALTSEARVIALDEPTSSLSVAESDQLFAQLDRLRAAGTAIILITHRIRDVFEFGDRVSVLRDGRLVGTSAVDETDEDTVVRMMIGRPLDVAFPDRAGAVGEDVALRVTGLASGTAVSSATLHVRRGEVVGLYGLVGAGRSELAQAIFGLRQREAGRIEVDGRPLRAAHTPSDAMRLGIAFLPEDRTTDGLFTERTVAENIVAPRFREYGSMLLDSRRMQADADGYIRRLAIKGGSRSAVKTLSGGNQQKVLFARWSSTAPRVLIVDEPTRGVDVGTKVRLHRELRAAAESGQAVLMISSELPEVLGMSDRVYVMAGGRITGEFDGASASEEQVLRSGSAA
jgi:ribose transport system ATP-binding protein